VKGEFNVSYKFDSGDKVKVRAARPSLLRSVLKWVTWSVGSAIVTLIARHYM
jgi:hypothetical protein